MTTDEKFMHRCISLARLAEGRVAPNPLVGSVLVYENRIIGEGYHQYYGGPHAEVNCIQSVSDEDRPLIAHSVLYVSLEPCAHFGKTPPCSNLIISHNIKKVIIGCRDPFVEVNGKGIEKLQFAGIEVVTGVLESECRLLNKRFFTFHTGYRPYVILKWAQTNNAKIAVSRAGGVSDERLYISNAYTNRVVHKWRSEEASILVGTNTALMDDPELTNRYWPGATPARLVVDMDLKLPSKLKIFNDGKAFTLVFNTKVHELDEGQSLKDGRGVGFYQVTSDVTLVQQVVHALYQLKVLSVLVEGGAQLLQTFIDEGVWDEARIITNPGLYVEHGVPAPTLSNQLLLEEKQIMSDQIHYFANKNSVFSNSKSV